MSKSRARDSLNSDSEKRPSYRRKTTQQRKTSFRSTSTWQRYKKKRKHIDGDMDYITHHHLQKGWSLHHMDLDPSHYTDISDDSDFICLNKEIHTVVHQLYPLYEQDEEIISRLEEVLHMMKDINYHPEKDADKHLDFTDKPLDEILNIEEYNAVSE